MACSHNKKTIWETQKFSSTLNTEYEYSICVECNEKIYTGNLKMVSIEETLRKKAMNEKASKTSKKIKRLHAKSGKKESLKQFARSFQDELSSFWFENKKGTLSDKRSDKNRKRISEEKMSKKSSKSKNEKK